MDLQQKVMSILDKAEGTFGVSIKHMNTKEEAHVNGDRLFQMASVFKIPILAVLYEEAHKGNINLHERITITPEDLVPGSGVIKEFEPGVQVTIKDLATMMIIVSDNLATDKVLSLLGADYVQQRMHDLGLHNIYVKHSCWELLSHSAGIPPKSFSKEDFDEITRRLTTGEYDKESIIFKEETANNVSSPKDMSLLLEKLALGQFVSEKCSSDIIDVMFKQQFVQRIPKLLPQGTKVANKTGSLQKIVNDAGIVYLPNDKGSFVISAFSKDLPSSVEAERTISQITLTAYQHFIDEA